MTQIETDVLIAAPLPEVYAYAASPRHWVEWYPGTTEVDGAPPGAPRVGDQWEETVKVAGMWMRFSWRATAVDAPHAWTLDGTATIRGPFGSRVQGGMATLVYRLHEEGNGTRLSRTATFRFSNPLLSLANRLLIRRKVAAELAEGLEHLSRIMERRHAAAASAGGHPASGPA